MASLVRRKIDQDQLSRVALLGAAQPILVEDVYDCAKMLAVVDPRGHCCYAAHPAGLVALCEHSLVHGGPEAKPYWMNVDE